jgi:hypothetical protein
MKLRTLLVFAAGIAAGLAIARKMREDDPVVLHGPAERAGSTNPALRLVGSAAQAVADRAGVASLDAIRRTRGAIRQRLGDDDGDAAWS